MLRVGDWLWKWDVAENYKLPTRFFFFLHYQGTDDRDLSIVIGEGKRPWKKSLEIANFPPLFGVRGCRSWLEIHFQKRSGVGLSNRIFSSNFRLRNPFPQHFFALLTCFQNRKEGANSETYRHRGHNPESFGVLLLLWLISEMVYIFLARVLVYGTRRRRSINSDPWSTIPIKHNFSKPWLTLLNSVRSHPGVTTSLYCLKTQLQQFDNHAAYLD